MIIVSINVAGDPCGVNSLPTIVPVGRRLMTDGVGASFHRVALSHCFGFFFLSPCFLFPSSLPQD